MNFVLAAIITLVPPAVGHFPKNIIFVVDTSGSMDGRKIVAAMEAFTLFASQPTDEMQIKVIAFQSSFAWWKKEWTPLPDADALKAAAAWMIVGQKSRKLGGGTRPLPALHAALDDPEKQTAVVLISDSEFTCRPEGLKKLEKKTKRKILGTVVIGDISDPDQMKKIGKIGRGGCYKIALIESREAE